MNSRKLFASAFGMIMMTSAIAAGVVETTKSLELGNIRGRITDSEKQVLPGATIMIEDLHTGVTSDINGYYSLPNLKPGTYKVKVSYVGYAPKVYTIKVGKKSVEQNITLDTGKTLDEVVVTGAFYGQRMH